MKCNTYYLQGPQGIVAGPFPTVDAAVKGKEMFYGPYRSLLTVVKSVMEVEPV